MQSPGGRKGLPRWDPSPRHVKAASQTRWGRLHWEAGRWLKEEGQECTFFQQILHLGTRAVVIDTHIETQAPEALEKSLCIFVCAVADTHSCGNRAPSSPMGVTCTKGEYRHPLPHRKVSPFMWLVLMLSHVRLSATPWSAAHQAPLSMGTLQARSGVDCHFLLQGIFPTQGSNLCLLWLLHWQADSLALAPPGKPHHLAQPTPNSSPPPSSFESFGPSPTSANPHDGNLKLKVPSFPSSLSPGHVTPPAQGLSAIAGRHSGLLTNVWYQSEWS